MTKGEFKSIDEYIAAQAVSVRAALQQVRSTIALAAPSAEEKISYKMPAFFLNGILVYFAAFKNHIGFYPTASGVAAFEKDLGAYKHAKGSIQFPLDQPLPLTLIRKMVKFRVEQNKR